MEDDQILIDQENQEKEDQALFLAEQKAVEEIVNESQIDNIKQGSVVDNPKPAKKNICTANTFQTSMKIPYDQILKNIPNLEYHELVYHDGGHIPIKRLYPFIYGNWRIKVRILSKGERRNWDNDKGRGCLMNVEMID